MISDYWPKRYCCEDISLIENYDKAINDKTQTWHCHHKNEITLNMNQKELQDAGLFWDRPANELIFLTKSEHKSLHMYGTQYAKGCVRTEETKKKISKTKKEQSVPAWNKGLKGYNSGNKNPAFGRKWISNGIERKYLKKEEAEEFLIQNPDWHFGQK